MRAGVANATAAVLFDDVLRVARLRGASDVHLHPDQPPVARIHGSLHRIGESACHADELTAIAEHVLRANGQERIDGQDDVTAVLREQSNVRVHIYRTSAGTALALRLLGAQVPRLQDLLLPASVEALTERTSGLILVAGPTGSGKSTLLAALVQLVNARYARTILTLEDPVEFRHTPEKSVICHREIGRDVATFADGLRGALRCDADVILIGELRDAPTMHAALTAAETGHLVLATVHTSDAAQTIDRIVGSFAGEMQEQIRVTLAQTLAGVVCMRLVPLQGGGRRACCEVLLATDAVRNLIREAKTHMIRNVIATSRHQGMQTLESHLRELLRSGDIALETAARFAQRPDEVSV